jgi:hypothetical protein
MLFPTAHVDRIPSSGAEPCSTPPSPTRGEGRRFRCHAFAFSRRNTPELDQENSSAHQTKRARGRPGAAAPAASCVKWKTHELVTTGVGGSIRPSLRDGFNGFLRALLGDRAFLPPSPARYEGITCVMRRYRRQFERQRRGVRTTRLRRPRSARLVFARRRVHRIPHSTFVTIAIRPSDRGGTAECIVLILAKREAVYF